MNREKLAQHLFDACWGTTAPTPWALLTPTGKEVWFAVEDAARSALKGPRTGEELYEALRSARRAKNPMDAIWDWAHLSEGTRAAYNTVAATFSTPPEPVGWPEGIRHDGVYPAGDRGWVCKIFADGTEAQLAAVYGATKEEAESRARLIAWTIANQRPVDVAVLDDFGRLAAGSFYAVAQTISGGEIVSRQIYEDLKRSIDGPGGWREHVEALRAEQTEAMRRDIRAGSEAARTGCAANLATHLHGPALDHLRDTLDQLVYDHTITPEESIAARRSPSALAALLLRVRGMGEVEF